MPGYSKKPPNNRRELITQLIEFLDDNQDIMTEIIEVRQVIHLIIFFINFFLYLNSKGLHNNFKLFFQNLPQL